MVFSRYVVSGSISDVYPGVRTLRRGKHRLFLWAGREADGSDDPATPSKLGTRDEMGRLEKVCEHSCYFQHIDRFRQLVKKYERGDLPKCDWLDNLTFRKMASIHAVTMPPTTADCSSHWFLAGRNPEI
jgi:phosphatidylinositol 3-kinase